MAQRFTRTDVLDVLIRVPPVFLMDASLNYWTWSSSSLPATSPSTPGTTGSVALGVDIIADDRINSSWMSENGHLKQQQQQQQQRGLLEEDWDVATFSECLLRFLGVISALVLFVLHTKYLLRTYRWMASVGCILASHYINSSLTTAFDGQGQGSEWWTSTSPTLLLLLLLFLQCVLAAIFVFECKLCWDSSIMHKVYVALAFVVPSITMAVIGRGDEDDDDIDVDVDGSAGRKELLLLRPSLALLPRLCAFLLTVHAAIEVLVHVPAYVRLARRAVIRARIIARHHGLPLQFESEWTRLFVPHVLRVFWLARFVEQLVLMQSSSTAPNMSVESMLDAGKQLLARGCDTVVAVLGLTSVVSSVAHHLGCAVQCFLLIQDDDENSFGTVSAILFFMLALQTGLTGLEPDKRFIRLYRNFCLLFTAILHFVHNMVSPVLMSLSASRNRSRSHHGRALSLCLMLVACPCCFLVYLWRTHQVSTWLLAVSAFSIEVTVRVVISLLIYGLFMWDAYRNTFWERLDDYVYYVRATGNTVEFLFGIFLFFNGAWILLLESGGTIRACMMCIHAYFNIWMQAKSGWKVFIRRRTAVNKINAFPEASVEQLRRLDDVCAICYQDMASARITWCGHYFHALCLRKWLYIQDRCPMCHKPLYKIDEEDDEQMDEDAEAAAAAAAAAVVAVPDRREDHVFDDLQNDVDDGNDDTRAADLHNHNQHQHLHQD